jgi:hypothetical protein
MLADWHHLFLLSASLSLNLLSPRRRQLKCPQRC